MGMNLANEFSEMKVGMGIQPIQPNTEKAELSMPSQLPGHSSTEVKIEPTAKQENAVAVTAGNDFRADSAILAGQNLRNDYSGDMGPKSDISFAAKTMGKDIGEACKGLFSALGSKADEPATPEPANVQPVQRAQPAFGL